MSPCGLFIPHEDEPPRVARHSGARKCQGRPVQIDAMQQNPPSLGEPAPEIPGRAAVVPMLPTRVRRPGRRAPLPDAVAVRRTAVPEPGPPYDDEADKASKALITPAASASSAPARTGSGSSPGDSRRLPPARGGAAWPSQFAQVLAETLAGERPAQQLTPWTTEQTRRRIRQLGPSLTSRQRPHVRRVMTSAPAPGVLELTAVVRFGPTVRVLAVRLEGRAGATGSPGSRWCCTAIESA